MSEPSDEEMQELIHSVDEGMTELFGPKLTPEEQRSLQIHELDELSDELRRLEGEEG